MMGHFLTIELEHRFARSSWNHWERTIVLAVVGYIGLVVAVVKVVLVD